MKNRTITGHWGKETISRPKTLEERHPDTFKPKHKALEREGPALWKAKAAAKGGEARKKEIETARSKILAHMSKSRTEPTEHEQRNYQNRTGRGYNE